MKKLMKKNWAIVLSIAFIFLYAGWLYLSSMLSSGQETVLTAMLKAWSAYTIIFIATMLAMIGYLALRPRY